MVRKSIGFLAIAALTVSSAQAATLTNIQGAVAVNAGDGYVPVAVPATVVPGDRIRTGAGSADIVYENGYTVHVPPKHVVLVSAAAPGSTSGGGLADGEANIGPLTAFASGLIIGGGIAAGISQSEGNKDPASP